MTFIAIETNMTGSDGKETDVSNTHASAAISTNYRADPTTFCFPVRELESERIRLVLFKVFSSLPLCDAGIEPN